MPTERHAFISYVKEDRERAVELAKALEAAGISVWLDKSALQPGQDWELEIRRAIQSGSLAFIACFSTNSESREKSYAREELVLAVDEHRKRALGAQWLFPVRFDEVAPPEYKLGGGRTLTSIHFTDLFGDGATVELVRLIQSLLDLLRPATTPAVAAGQMAAQLSTSPGIADRVKSLLRDPYGDIQLEELVTATAREAAGRLNDETRFPLVVDETKDDVTSLGWVKRVDALLRDYQLAMDDLQTVFELVGLYGRPEHRQMLRLATETIGATVPREQNGNTLLLPLRYYPLALLTYTVGIAGISRGSYTLAHVAAFESKIDSPNGPKPVSKFETPATLLGGNDWVGVAIDHVRDHPEFEVSQEWAADLSNRRMRDSRMADILFSTLKARFEPRFARANEYEAAYFRWEVLLDAERLHSNRIDTKSRAALDLGRYVWREVHSDHPPELELIEELQTAEDGWTPLLDGWFSGNAAKAAEALSAVQTRAENRRNDYW